MAERLVQPALDAIGVENGNLALILLHAVGKLRRDAAQGLAHLVDALLVGEHKAVHIVGEQIAHRAREQRLVPVDAAGRAAHLAVPLHLAPQGGQVGDVRKEVLAVHALGLDALGLSLEALALRIVAYAAGDADIVHHGHQHHKAARQRDVRCDACALWPIRLLDHLHHDLLTGLDHLFDGLDARGHALAEGAVLAKGVVALVHPCVAHVEEGVAVRANIHKRGLHAGQHVLHPALVDIARQLLGPLALEVEFAQLPVLHHGHARQFFFLIDDDFLLAHFCPSPASNSPTRPPSFPLA